MKLDKKQLEEDLERFQLTFDELKAGMGKPLWRLSNLYKIVNADKEVVTFHPNNAQKRLIEDIHTRNVILKARKMGFSTFIQIYMLDTALFSPNERCVVIAQDLLTAEAIFRDTIKFAYDQLPELFKSAAPTESDPSKSKIIFTNGSIIEVRTSARGNTPTVLHISEFGKISAKDTGKAREIVTGAMTAVARNGVIFVESTAEAGEEGEFYKLVNTAVRLQETGKRLSNLEFKFHFYGWWRDERYREKAGYAVISPKEHEYFDGIEAQIGQQIDLEQRTWYVLTRDNTYSGDQQMMYQEFPSTWEEAFKVSMDGAYFTEQFRALRKQDRIGNVPYDPAYPVCSFWDIGASDTNAVWMAQAKPTGYSVINYIEACGEPFNYFIAYMQEQGYVWDMHYIPHDANQRRQQGYVVTTAEEMLRDLAPNWNFYLIPRTPDKRLAIQQARNILPLCSFDAENCKTGIRHLEAYRKELDTRTGAYRSTPRHGPESNAADAFLQMAQAQDSGAFGAITNMLGNGGAGDFGNAFGGFYQPQDMGY